jgi:autotransporter-associated beta strand protein
LTVGGVSVAANKVYDGSATAAVTGGSLVGVVGLDSVTLNQTGTFAQTTVGSAISVTANDSISGTSAGNYSLIQPTGLTANITPKDLTVSGVTVANKVYDGTTSAVVTGGTLVGLIGSDGANVALTQTATFSSANVGNAISVALSDSISGTASGNYTLIQPSAVMANITPKALTVTGTVASNKVYDGTSTASVSSGSLVGVITADVANVTLTQAGSFSSSNVGSAIAITMNDSIGGSAASNYSLTQPEGVNANITTKALTITAGNVSSVYGSTTSLGNTAFTQSGLIAGDAISAVTLLYSGSNAVASTVNTATYNGSIIPSAATGTGLSNYAITYVAGNLTVTPATLTLTPIAQSVVYNGNTLNATTYSASAANYVVSGYQNTDSASNVALSFTGSLGFTANGSSASVLNAGTYGYAAGNLAMTTTNANYQVVLASALNNNYVVRPATVGLSVSKVFDGTTGFTAGDAGTTLTVTTGIGSQTLSVNGSANANSANVVGVTSLNTTGLMLADGTGLASNYVLPASTGDVVITPKTITVSIANQTKVYDTNTMSTLTAGNSSSDGSYLLTGFMGNDGAYITQTAANYNNANVANATTVTATVGSSYVAKGGAVLSNYALPATVSTVVGGGTITPAPLTMTANDLSTFVSVAPSNINSQYQLTGLVGADTASTAISNATVTYSSSLLSAGMSSPALNALTPSATSSNYTLTFVKGSLMVADNYQMIVNAGSNTATYGAVDSINISFLGNALSSSNGVTAGYCTNCGQAGVTSPTIINLTITAPVAGSNVWTAADSLGSGVGGTGAGQGKYTFEITPTVATGSYGSGSNLNVGNYVLATGNLQLVANYTRNYSALKPIIYNGGTLSVTPKVLTVSGSTVANKVYDATNSAVITNGQLVGLAANDASYINLVQTGSFASLNVANGIAINVLDSLSGSVSSNYVLTQPTGLTANISAAPVTISGLTAANKVYNANTTASLSGTPTITGFLGSDTATISSGNVSGVFASPNVGLGIAITPNVSGLNISNGNYYVTGLTTPLTADITPAAITVSAAKSYDGTNTISANQMSIVGVAGQVLSFAVGSTGTLSNPNVGSATLASLNNAVLVDGTGLASNYTVVNPIFDAVTINPAVITVGVNNLTKVYDKTVSTASVVTAPTLVLKSGTLFTNENTGSQDTLSGGLFEYANVNAGVNKTVNIQNASVISGLSTVTQNYSINYQANTTSEISAAPVIIGGLTTSNKVYDTTRAAVLTGTPVIASGLMAGDSSNLSGSATAGLFANANVGSGISVIATLDGLTLSNTNYYVAGVSTALAANISAAPVTISGLTAANKVYDTTTIASLSGAPTVAGFLNGDTGLASGTYSGAFTSANKGTGIAVTADLSGLTLSNSNYYISGVTTPLTANITAAPISIGGLAASDKVYDTNRVAVLNGTPIIATGLLGSDSATISGTATAGIFAGADVGTGIAVTPTLSGLNLSNANYYIASVVSPLSANIAPAPLTITGLTVANKVYDTTTNVVLSGTPTISGLLPNDVVTVTGNVSGSFASANVGVGIAVNANLNGLTLSNANYYVAGVATTLTADITAAPLTVTADDKVMVYGSSLPTLTYSYVGLVGSDTSSPLTGALVTNATSSASVGNAYTITQGTLSVSGNYRIGTFNAATVTINQRPVTVTIDPSQSKVYGAADPSTFTATIQAQGTDVGLLSGSSLAGSLARLTGENVGSYAFSQGTLASANPNYAITLVGANFSITPRPITVTANSNQTKVYGDADGVLTYSVTSGSLASFNNVADTLSGVLTRDAGNQVGTSYGINQGGVTSAANPNYAITFESALYRVTPRLITLTAPSINKIYDGGYTYDLTAADLAVMNGQLFGSDTFNAVKAIFYGNNPNVGTNKVIVIDPATVSINDGNSGRNYTVNVVNSTGNISPASLIVTAANDAKFAIQSDTPGYGGALYQGFINGDTVSSLPAGNQNLVITRSDSANNAPGPYVLTPSGLGANGAVVGNYQISYVNGTFRILDAHDLLIRAASTSNYGSAPIYTLTAQYLASDGTSLPYIGNSGLSSTAVNLMATGSASFVLNDGVGTLTARLMPAGAATSASGNTNAGQYNITAASGWTQSSNTFQNLVVVGKSIVNPLVITTPSLSGSSITKVYDGSAVVSSQVTNLMSGSSQLIAGDAATLSANGVYDNKNVGTSKQVTINFAISGVDAANYTLSASQVSGAYGAITQLASVTYIGPVGGDWSAASNWTGGAVPDLSNVANVIIPTGKSVSYDASVAGPVTSQVAANGALNLANAGVAVSLGGISGSGSIALGSNGLTLSAAANGNFSGVISGSGGLTVAGGTQTLSGVNTYTGNTAVDAGATLIIGGAGVLGGGNYAGTITNNGTFIDASSANQTLSGVISGSGDLDKTGTGTLTLTAANTYSGATVVDSGTLAITDPAGLGASSAGTIINSGGTLDLRNVIGVAEPITVNGGTLATSIGSSSVTAPITLTGNSVVDVTGTQLTLSNTVSGSGSLDKTGAGTLMLTAANTYTGATVVDAGTLAITDPAALGATTPSSIAGTTVNAGGTLDLRNVTGVAEPITLNGGTLATSNGSSSVTAPIALTGNSVVNVTGTQLTLSNTVSGSGSLDKTGAGTLVLTAANTYTGATVVDAGTLVITDAAALGATTPSSTAGTTVNTGGTLDLRNVTGVAEPITLNGGTLAVSSGSSSVTAPISLTTDSAIAVTGTQLTLSNTISGAGGLDKTGAGTLVLTAANTYTGPTVVDAGTLQLTAGASIADSSKVVVNGVLDLTAITDNVSIQSLGGSGSVITGSVAPNSLVLTNAGDTFSGTISGTGGLRVAGGTQTLTGINTYSGPTVVDPGANLIAGVQSIPGDIVNNGGFGFNQSTAGSFTHNMSGSGTMTISGTGPITLTGVNTQAGGTQIDSGASLIIGAVNALSGNQVQSNGGSFGIVDGLVLSSLNIAGSVILTSDIYTTGAQSYGNIRLAPSSDSLTTLQTVNSNITITGTLDGTVAKIQSILINAGTAEVTFGDSVGSIARPNMLTVTGSRIFILADILTGDKQEYNGATSIGDGTYIGKAFVKGFLYDSHYQYFEYAANGLSSKISSLNNDARYVRTLVSKDPTVTFNGTVDDVTDYTHTLLVAAIAANTTTALASSTMPVVNFNNSVSQVIPLYSLNVQTVAALNNTNAPDLATYVGQINITGNVTTYSNQVFHSNSIPVLSGSQGAIFSVYQPTASISFLLPPQLAGSLFNSNLIFNGQTNLSNWGSGFTQNRALGALPVQLMAVFNSSVDGSVLHKLVDYHADQAHTNSDLPALSRVSGGSSGSVEITAGSVEGGSSNKKGTSKFDRSECETDAMECEQL